MPEPALVAGTWTTTPAARPVRSPHDGSTVAEVCLAGPAELERAAAGAVSAFRATRSLPAHRRSEILRAASAALLAGREDFARTIALEAGKPLRLARAEVDRAAGTFSLAADEARRLGGEVVPLDALPSGAGRVGLTRRFPAGPVLAITPFNFPLNLVAHKVAPAIAAGNPVVLKPASATPLSSLRLARVLLEAGLPPEALSVLPCPGAAAEALVADPRFRVFTFTGSPEVGWALRAKAGPKRVALELGGNAALVVHDDADLADAVERAVHGSYAYSGQVCISVQRIYVQERVLPEFRERFVARAGTLAAGDPLAEATELGPLIDDAAADRVSAWLAEAAGAGVRTLCGGRRSGRRLDATLLEGARPGLKVHDLEVFGPVALLQSYRDFEEGLRLADDPRYGLQAGVFTRDVGRVFRAFEALDVGGVVINDAPTFRSDHMPYGGEKLSGLGREGVKYAVEEMTILKSLSVKLP